MDSAIESTLTDKERRASHYFLFSSTSALSVTIREYENFLIEQICWTLRLDD